jgi:hypothetical protein
MGVIVAVDGRMSSSSTLEEGEGERLMTDVDVAMARVGEGGADDEKFKGRAVEDGKAVIKDVSLLTAVAFALSKAGEKVGVIELVASEEEGVVSTMLPGMEDVGQ